jgi:thymidylate synthase
VNRLYLGLIREILDFGDLLDSRCGPVKSLFDATAFRIDLTPLVTVRRTAWKMALREMEWFLSGDPRCPPDLLGWWRGQLSACGAYRSGYGEQWRHYGGGDVAPGYDQIQSLLDGIRAHPHSRRLVATTWHPEEMARITAINDNPATPTTCHGTVLQAFVRGGRLHLKTYQRSADVLLGVPHNWIQYWALLLWLAHHAELEPGTLGWTFGDLHLYQHETHLAAAREMLADPLIPFDPPRLVYRPAFGGRAERPTFHAHDFTMEGAIPPPVTTVRPLLLTGHQAR